MALPTNNTTTYSVIGNREDLVDIIYDISPTDTPFLTNANRNVKATAVNHEWQTDALAAAATNIKLEGDNAAGATLTAAVRLSNYCQIMSKTVSVSGTQKAVNHAGVADEKSYQISKRGKEIKRDMEYALTRNAASSAGGIGTGRTLGSIESWLAGNKVSVGTGTAQTTIGYASGVVSAPTDSTVAGTFTAASLKNVIQQCWTDGGDPKLIMTGPFNKSVASAFTGIATPYRDNPGKAGPIQIIGAADVYVSDFGTHQIVANRFQRDQTVLVLDMDYLAVAFLRNMEMKELGIVGDSEQTLLVTEFTLQVSNPDASGKITDCTTS